MKKNNNQFVNGNMTIIGVGTVIEGVLKASTSTRIEGTVNGDITSDGIVVIANEGVVNGNILAADVKISGTVKGNLTISGKTELVSNGKLVGDVLPTAPERTTPVPGGVGLLTRLKLMKNTVDFYG